MRNRTEKHWDVCPGNPLPIPLDTFAGFAVDLDGVIWRGTQILPGATEGMLALRRLSKPVVFLTNNGAHVPEEAATRLRDAGIDASPEEILNTCAVTVRWLAERSLTGAEAYVLAPQPVVDQLEPHLDIRPPGAGEQPAVVVVGRDSRFDFQRLDFAARAIRNGSHFVALNKDATYPVENGLEPGTGAIVAAIEAASGMAPIVMGKPELSMMEAAAQLLGTNNVLMIGDRLDSDIEGAARIGWQSALLLSGVTAVGEYAPAPDYILESLGDLASS